MTPTVGIKVHFYPNIARAHDDPRINEPVPLIAWDAFIFAVNDELPTLQVVSPDGLVGSGTGFHFFVDCRPGKYQPQGVSRANVPTMGCWNYIP